ncbi:MAG: hypothetical protein P8X74_06495 [Reinekea sp.]
MLPRNWGEPMGAPVIFEQQIGIKLLHPASTEGVTDSGRRLGHKKDSCVWLRAGPGVKWGD